MTGDISYQIGDRNTQIGSKHYFALRFIAGITHDYFGLRST
jgi:hypothetical protein